eukprot:maker-scaffold_1-snap-gene-23.22-mRNA-1 protein AED:0.05 eAED:0.05 QI:0/1/0.5/1/1/1/2/118/469
MLYLEYERILDSVEKQKGNVYRSIVNEVLRNGWSSPALAVKGTLVALNQSDDVELARKFDELIEDRIFVKIPQFEHLTEYEEVRVDNGPFNNGGGKRKKSGSSLTISKRRKDNNGNNLNVPLSLKMLLNKNSGSDGSTVQRKPVVKSKRLKKKKAKTQGLFRVNFNYFANLFRLNFVREYIVRKTGKLLIAPLVDLADEYTTKEDFDVGSHISEKDFQLPEYSHLFSKQELLRRCFQELNKEFKGEEEVALEAFLTTLKKRENRVLDVSGDGGQDQSLCLYFENIMDDIKERSIMMQIKQEFGAPALRIYSLLKEFLDSNRKLLQKGKIGLTIEYICENALLPKDLAAKTIFSLFQAGILQWEQGFDYNVKQGTKGKVSAPFFCLDKSEIYERYVNVTYKGLTKTLIRKKALVEKNTELHRFKSFEELETKEFYRVPGVQRYLKYKHAISSLNQTILDVAENALLLDYF